MSSYEGTRVAEFVTRLEERPDLPELEPSINWDAGLTGELQALAIDDLFGNREVLDRDFAEATRSGLLLWNDALHESHVVSQSIDTATGSYWHGIMHRREADYGNSKYWFRNVGRHDAMAALSSAARDIAAAAVGESSVLASLTGFVASMQKWDPFQFVDWCEEAASGSMPTDAIEFLRSVQLAEIRNLLDYSVEHAGSADRRT